MTPRRLLSLLALSVLFTGCDCGGTITPPVTDGGLPVGDGTVTVLGRVVGPDEAPVAGGRVSVGGDETTTADDGRFLLTTGPGVGRAVVVRAEGFAKAERRVDLSAGRVASAGTIALTPVAAEADVGPEGGTVESSDGAVKVVVPAGAFAETVHFTAAPIPVGDALVDDLRLPAPLPEAAGAVTAPLFAVILDAEGRQPAAPLEVTMASAALPAGTPVPVGRFDPDRGAWVDVGTATAGADGLVFATGHLSTFAAGLPALPTEQTDAPDLDGLERVPAPFPSGEPRVDPRTGALQVGLDLPALVRRGAEVRLTLFHDSRTSKATLSVPAAVPDAQAGEDLILKISSPTFGERRGALTVASGAFDTATPAVAVASLPAPEPLPLVSGTPPAASSLLAETETWTTIEPITVVESRFTTAELFTVENASFSQPEVGDPVEQDGAPVLAPEPIPIRNVTLRKVPVDDRSKSPFGAGWHVQGLTRLVQPQCREGEALLAGGFETPAMRFTPGEGLFLSRIESALFDAGVPEEALNATPWVAWSDGLYVGLRAADHVGVWRIDGAGVATRVAGTDTVPTAPQRCDVAALERYMDDLTGLSAAPDRDGIVLADTDCVLHVKADGTTVRIMGGPPSSVVPVAPGPGVALEAVDFAQEIQSFTAGPEGTYFVESWTAGPFLAKDGTLEPLRLRVNHPHGHIVAFDRQGAFVYLAYENACMYRYVDGLNDTPIFPNCQTEATELKDGPVAEATVGMPWGVGFDDTGALWFVDAAFGALRRLDTEGEVVTVAGGTPGEMIFGEGGAAKDARLGSVYTVAVGAPDEIALGTVGAVLRLGPPAADGNPLRADDGSSLVKNDDGTWTRTLQGGLVERYDARGLLVSRGPVGEPPLEYGYDAWDGPPEDERCGFAPVPPLLRRITLSGEDLFTFEYTGDGRLSRVRDAAGRNTSLTWAGDRMDAVTLPGGARLAFAYDEDGRVTKKTTPGPRGNPVVWAYAYDDEGRIVSADVPGRGRRTWEAAEAAVALPEAEFSPAGVLRGGTAGPAEGTLPTDRGAEAKLRLGTDRLTVTTPDGDETELGTDEAGRVSRVTDPDGNTLRLSRDEAGRIVELLNEGSGDRWAYRYDDASGKMTARTDPAGKKTTYAYDGQGRLLSRRDPEGGTTSFVYGAGAAAGLPSKVTDPLGVETEVVYDGKGNAVRYVLPGGLLTEVDRDAAGRPVAVTEPSGLVRATEYDGLGGVVRQVEGDPADGHVVTYERVMAAGWESVGSHVPASAMISATDGAGRTWSFARDDAFSIVRSETPGDGLVQETYDDEGRRTRRDLADGSSEAFTWGDDGRLAERRSYGPADGAWLALAYDELGRVERLSGASVVETRTFTPGLGLASMQIAPQAGLDAAAAFRMTRGRPAWHRTSESVDDTTFHVVRGFDGRIETAEVEQVSTHARRQVLAATWDAARRLSVVTRGNGTTTTRAYDEFGRVVRQDETTPFGTTVLAWTYDDAGRPLTRSVDGAVRTYAYDDHGRLVSCSDTGETYAWDAVDARASAGGAAVVRDARGRLTGDGAVDYAYDEVGRRVAATPTADPSARLEFVYGPGGRLAEVRRGPAGSATTIATYAYDGSGRRIRRTTADGSWLYGWLPDGDRLVRVVEPDGTAWHLLNGFGSAAWTVAVTDAGAERYTHVDPFERVVGVSDETGRLTLLDEDCFGRRLTPAGVTGPDLGMHGMPYDPETGLYSAAARYYDPATGEFLTPDVRGLEAGLNPWGYGTGNPVIQADPGGRLFFVAMGALLAGAVIAKKIHDFAKSAEVKRARRSYQDITEIEGSDDKLASAEKHHERLYKASDKGGDTAIDCVKTFTDSATNPAKDFNGLKDQIKGIGKDLVMEGAKGYLEGKDSGDSGDSGDEGDSGDGGDAVETGTDDVDA